VGRVVGVYCCYNGVEYNKLVGCIAALFLTNYYSSVLTSLITVSSPVPTVNSIEDVANNDDIELVVLKVSGTAGFIAVCFQHFIIIQLAYYYFNQKNRIHILKYPNRVS